MRLKSLLYCHLAILILVGSFFLPGTSALWEMLDVATFKFLNSFLQGRPSVQLFWALLNHHLADWVEDVIFIAFFVWAVRSAPSSEKLKRVSQFIFCIFFAAAVIFFVNKTLFRDVLKIPRASPSMVIHPCVHLADEVTWIKVKDHAPYSFPGDHATTLIFFAATYTFYAGRKKGIYAILYACVRVLPRMIVGAHWLTDLVVGSGAVALFFLSWALCTPFHVWVTGGIERGLRKLAPKEKLDEKETLSL